MSNQTTTSKASIGENEVPDVDDCPQDSGSILLRAADEEDIIRLLLQPGASKSGDNLPVFSTVRLRGVDKRLLAERIYNDDRVKEHFVWCRTWVSVRSDGSNPEKICIKMLNSLSTMLLPQHLAPSLVQSHFPNLLPGIRFLLVLDGIEEEHLQDLEYLVQLLQIGARGSKIVLIPARAQKITPFIRTQLPFVLYHLPEKECWSLFKYVAFPGRLPGHREEMEEIGMYVVHKYCESLPLTVEEKINPLEMLSPALDPSIKSLLISHCHNLKSVPEIYSKLEVCSYLRTVPEILPNLAALHQQMLETEGFEESCSLPNRNSSRLELLEINYFNGGKLVMTTPSYSYLLSLFISGMDNFDVPPGLLQYVPLLEELHIPDSNLVAIPQAVVHKKSLERLSISDCPNLWPLISEGTPKALQAGFLANTIHFHIRAFPVRIDWKEDSTEDPTRETVCQYGQIEANKGSASDQQTRQPPWWHPGFLCNKGNGSQDDEDEEHENSLDVAQTDPVRARRNGREASNSTNASFPQQERGLTGQSYFRNGLQSAMTVSIHVTGVDAVSGNNEFSADAQHSSAGDDRQDVQVIEPRIEIDVSLSQTHNNLQGTSSATVEIAGPSMASAVSMPPRTSRTTNKGKFKILGSRVDMDDDEPSSDSSSSSDEEESDNRNYHSNIHNEQQVPAGPSHHGIENGPAISNGNAPFSPSTQTHVGSPSHGSFYSCFRDDTNSVFHGFRVLPQHVPFLQEMHNMENDFWRSCIFNGEASISFHLRVLGEAFSLIKERTCDSFTRAELEFIRDGIEDALAAKFRVQFLKEYAEKARIALNIHKRCTAVETQIHSLESQIQGLKDELTNLKRELNSDLKALDLNSRRRDVSPTYGTEKS